MTREILGIFVASMGLLFSFMGILIIYKYKGFYIKAATTSLIDSIGFIFIVIGIMIYNGANFISLKLFLLLIFSMMLNPLSNHYIVKCAYKSGYKDNKDISR